MIKAIETSFQGYRFRSRLEARWAVFFDSLGIKWEYEPEGFHVDDLGLYLPDFHLPDLGTWVEVKGNLDSADDMYLEMIANAIDWGGALPNIANSGSTTRGLLWLGDIPTVRSGGCIPAHSIFQHCKGGWCNLCHFTESGQIKSDDQMGEYFDSSWGGDACAKVIRKHLQEYSYNRGYYYRMSLPTKLERAYIAARAARFEHGEKPL